jgi:hypothetical protein
MWMGEMRGRERGKKRDYLTTAGSSKTSTRPRESALARARVR